MSSLPSSAGGAEYEKFRAALALKESAGNPSAIQWDTKARGLFQFIPRWHAKWIKEELGRDLDTFLPKDSSPEEMARATKEQTEILFPKYYERELSPFIKKMRKAGVGKGYSDAELGAMAHFAGTTGAEKYLRTGFDNTLGTIGNSAGGIADYVKQFDKYYNSNPEGQFATFSESAKHYGEYGLGRGVYEIFTDKDLAYTKSNEKLRNKAIRQLYKGGPALAFTAEEKAGKPDGEPPTSLAQNGLSPEKNLFLALAQAPGAPGAADVMDNENSSVLSQLIQLNAKIAGQPSAITEHEYFNRLRREGRGA